MLLIEDNSRGQDPALAQFMQRYPYKSLGHQVVNAIYVRDNEPQIMQRLKWMMFT